MAAKKKKPRVSNRTVKLLVLLAALVLIPLGVVLANQAPTYKQATGLQLEQARQAIANQYLADSSINCSDATDPIKPQARVAVFYKYLRVNQYANRAVIRGCNNIDSLLAKVNNIWVRSEVNISLDTSANPVWQQACLIDDITRADTIVRPENSSIDATNLKLCNALKHNKILRIQDL
ncbi:MAG: hypothetical protein WC498_01270 [Candidatus Saccharimonadales bacterium]